jgi:hypothetical protein
MSGEESAAAAASEPATPVVDRVIVDRVLISFRNQSTTTYAILSEEDFKKNVSEVAPKVLKQLVSVEMAKETDTLSIFDESGHQLDLQKSFFDQGIKVPENYKKMFSTISMTYAINSNDSPSVDAYAEPDEVHPLLREDPPAAADAPSADVD